MEASTKTETGCVPSPSKACSELRFLPTIAPPRVHGSNPPFLSTEQALHLTFPYKRPTPTPDRGLTALTDEFQSQAAVFPTFRRPRKSSRWFR